MLEPIEKDIPLPDGGSKTYILSKFPAIAGREIVTQYPTSAAPKMGDYKTNEALMLKMMAYVAVPTDSGQLQLTTKELVNNHVPDFETLLKLEWAMMEYNCSFFRNGAALGFLTGLTGKLKQSVTQTLTDLLRPSSGKDAPASENSKKTTRSKKL
ncbi:hypothetical protein FHU10_5151 [Serratia fonticola]|jgi:hypothetical protein|uniref:Uncharacterized protein n=1 Tax=Serratia fonticola TaxID=47917 RepID=A0A559TCY4_SERFO|nr:hypothetical protein [Serratia fonticola]TQI79998.1 hypothetical protein FHU09_2553 [Serratia fonticola]TQI97976.1 hypothetical protein FHU11_3493 [Serratia fonticola]TVZ72471.1 hypothetical protein FHU10_5151 [Serratia fonticola]